MNKRVMSMLGAGVMAASTLLSSVPAFAANVGSGYVLMNIPYSVFYGGQGVTVDAVTTATPKINSTDLANSAYADADNQIKGVTLPVYVGDLDSLTGTKIEEDATLDVEWTARGQKNQATLKGREVLTKSDDYAYYVLGSDETPSVYADLTVEDGKYTISGLKGGSSTSALAVEMVDGAETGHTDYEIELGDSFSKDTIYGITLNTTDGSRYPLARINQIWRNLELGFNASDFSDIIGKKITGMTVYTNNGGVKQVNYEDTLLVKETMDGDVAVAAEDDKVTITIDGVAEDAVNATATVYTSEGSGHHAIITNIAAGLKIVDGKITLPEELAEGTYYVKIYSDNYACKAAANGIEITADGSEVVEPDKTEEKETTSDTSSSKSSRHTHTYAWEITQAATATTDGEMKYRCKDCGAVEYAVPISAYYVFNKNTQEAIKNAAAGATVTVETPVFISFHEMVKEALVERSDVTLVVDYKNAGAQYEMTIPAGSGATLEQLFGEDKFAGFLYLGGAFATVAR